jgi:hypothetical protein
MVKPADSCQVNRRAMCQFDPQVFHNRPRLWKKYGGGRAGLSADSPKSTSRFGAVFPEAPGAPCVVPSQYPTSTDQLFKESSRPKSQGPIAIVRNGKLEVGS